MNTNIAIIGGGPAGLMAAERLAELGHKVIVYEAMPTVARKFLLAGKSGLNLTHAEPYARLMSRYGSASPRLRPGLDAFPPEALRAWADGLGADTFVGSSGRVFPRAMKASPLLRAWLLRLSNLGVEIKTRHRWVGFDGDALRVSTPDGEITLSSAATLLALGGASWPRLGSDAAWVSWLQQRGVSVSPFRPANCGFDIDWSPVFRERFAGAPLKSVALRSAAGETRGEFVISRHGIEGSLVYGHAAAIRDGLENAETEPLVIDLQPDRGLDRLETEFRQQKAKISLSNRLRKGAGLDGVKAALLRELTPELGSLGADAVARRIKTLPLPVLRPRPITEAISSAGGLDWAEVDENLMFRRIPGLFAAGEMLDWEAPTGGYLLSACFASGRHVASGMHSWLCA
ncbi:putative flavoprotein (TIGR03862 family) [Rhizobium sp. SG_E_25_P2]|uniref:TIGR03862 family flavoprotein n=1 Tax=Rhizobium sp. SG_E_25_P2 TaxID=2879942 RepID=UPI0024769DDB|nr:TIGR03862 family flavoprotein [Rhizobium sp. SG_E_25_P2]MDH6265383.1 putative flavoprotein (TIGR03862 family) [Rhizobium sp. SG_E_25_P2]